MASEIRVNKINNRAGLGTVEYTPTGIIVSGIVTAYEFDGNFDTTPGIVVTGIATAAGIDLNGDLDVDGHTNLDNVSISGVTTFSGAIGGTFDVDGHTNLDNINISGMTTTTGNLYLDGGNINIGTGVTIKASGEATYSGIVTASAFKLSDGSTVGGAMTRDTQGNLFAGDTAGEDLNNSSGYNVLIGNKSGKNITSAQNNIFVGEETGESLTSGSGNIAIGTKTLEFAGASASANVVIGYNAGQQVSGDSNTVIGNSASGGAMTGQNNLILGNGASRSASGISNEITLGNSSINHLRVPGIGVSFSEGGAVIAGVVTATSFSGDGSSLSNLPAGAPVGGASTNTVFFENDKAVAVNYQVTSTKNAMSAGPIAINAGIAVTVPSGCSWTIV